MSEEKSIPSGSERTALDRIGWCLEDAFSGDATPTIRRGHNLVVISPPSAVYAAPALATLAANARPTGLQVLVLAHPSMIHEVAWVLELVASPAESTHLAIPDGARFTAPPGASASMLVTTPQRALDMASRSMLSCNDLRTVLLAWPECWDGDAGLQDLMADVPGGSQRLIYTSGPERARGIIERHAWRALNVGMPADALLAEPRAVRTVSVPWHRRGEALRGVLAALDPRTAGIWTATGAAAQEVRLALAGMMTGVTVFHDDVPEAEIIIAYDLPTPERLARWQPSGSRVVLVPPVAARYVADVAPEAHMLKLPGALEEARDEAASRRRTVADVLASTPLEGAILALAPLFDRFDPVQVAGALYQLWSAAPAAKRKPVAAPPPATVRMFVSAGKKDGVTVAELVAVLVKEIGVDRAAIGRIDLKETHALVELPARDADRIIVAMNGTRLRRKRVSARLDRVPGRER